MSEIINFGEQGPPGISTLGGADLPAAVGSPGQVLTRTTGLGSQGLPATVWATPAGGGGYTPGGTTSQVLLGDGSAGSVPRAALPTYGAGSIGGVAWPASSVGQFLGDDGNFHTISSFTPSGTSSQVLLGTGAAGNVPAAALPGYVAGAKGVVTFPGSPSATAFLRDDGTFAQPAGSQQRGPLPDTDDKLVYLLNQAVGVTTVPNLGALGAGGQYDLTVSGCVQGVTGFYADMTAFNVSSDGINSGVLASLPGSALDGSVFTLELVLFLFTYTGAYADLFGIQQDRTNWNGANTCIGLGFTNAADGTWVIRGEGSGITAGVANGYEAKVAVGRPIHAMAEIDLSGSYTNNITMYIQGRLALTSSSGTPSIAHKLSFGTNPAIYVGNAKNGAGFAGDNMIGAIQEARFAVHAASAGLRGLSYAKARAKAVQGAGY